MFHIFISIFTLSIPVRARVFTGLFFHNCLSCVNIFPLICACCVVLSRFVCVLCACVVFYCVFLVLCYVLFKGDWMER